MAREIAVVGESGNGKTTSERTLDPASTFIIDADKKGLNWRGWRKQYNAENRNYVATDNIDIVAAYLKRINGQEVADEDGSTSWRCEFPNVKTVVIDTGNALMVADEYRRRAEKGYDKWSDLAWSIWGLVDHVLTMRDDLTVVWMFHAQTERDDNGFQQTRIKTSGRKLDKLVLESKMSAVLVAKCVDGQYVFETHANNSTAKTPPGLYEDLQIPNDLARVVNDLREYDQGE